MVGVVATVLAVAGMPLPGAATDGSTTDAAPGAAPVAADMVVDARGPLGPVGVLGDSVTFGTATYLLDDLHAVGWGPVRAHTGVGVRIDDDRDFHALAKIRQWRAEGFSPTRWVVGLGYNDVGFTTDNVDAARALIETLLAEVGPDSEVLMATITHQYPSWAVAWNTALAEADAAHANLHVTDWAGVVAGHPEWLAPDQVHLTPTGYKQRSLQLSAASLALDRLRPVAPPGTPATGALGAPSGFVPLVPQRAVDTRQGRGGGRLAAGETRVVSVAGRVPDGTTAAAVNLTVDGADGAGYLTAWDCGAQPGTSALNYRAAYPAGAQSVVALAGSSFCVYTMTATDLVVDVFGAFTPSGARFQPTAPQRVLDSRTDGRVAPAPGATFRVTISGPGAEVPAAAVVNVTATEAGGDGYVTAFPCGSGVPEVSNLNHTTGGAIANLALVKLSATGELCLRTYTTTHVIVDLLGTFGSTGYRYQAGVPARLLDTRDGTGGWAGAANELVPVDVAAGAVPGVPADAAAVVGTVTAAGALEPGFVTTWPCAIGRPGTSTLNVLPGVITPNAAVIGLGADRRACVTSYAPAYVLFDLTGWYVP